MTRFYWEANYGTGELRIFAGGVDFAGIIPITASLALVAMGGYLGACSGDPGGARVEWRCGFNEHGEERGRKKKRKGKA